MVHKLVISMLLLLAIGLSMTSAQAQLVTVDERYYVTEVRRDQHKIGVSSGPDGKTRTWVVIDQRTRVSRNGYVVSRNAVYGIRPGTRIRVQGGRDFDQSVAAKKIWY